MDMRTIILGLVTGLASASGAENLIPFNSGFELGSPAGWYMWIDEQSGGNASFQTIDKDVHSGANALEFEVKRATREVWQISLSLPQWVAKPSTRYRVKFWAKGPGPLKVNASDAGNNYAWMGGYSAVLTPGADWMEVVGDVVTTTQSGKGKVSLGVGLGQVAGKYVFDDFSVEELGPSDK